MMSNILDSGDYGRRRMTDDEKAALDFLKSQEDEYGYVDAPTAELRVLVRAVHSTLSGFRDAQSAYVRAHNAASAAIAAFDQASEDLAAVVAMIAGKKPGEA